MLAAESHAAVVTLWQQQEWVQSWDYSGAGSSAKCKRQDINQLSAVRCSASFRMTGCSQWASQRERGWTPRTHRCTC